MLGLVKGELKLVEYNPLWAELFAKEKQNLLNLVGDFVVDIQHVGSTSIVGLAAKPVIDIAVGVNNLEDVKHCIRPLENTKLYVYKGINGVPGRELFAKYDNDRGTHHIHFEKIHEINWQNHIIFRDYLRNNDDIMKEYQDLKYNLFKKGISRTEYTESKAEFILQIINRAKKEGYHA
ncbi:MAG: GrpB family protein [Clostridia bacterium]